MKLFKAYLDKNKERFLKPGLITDSRGQRYQIDGRGCAIRISPERPWRGKSERRWVLKMRRFFKANPGTT